MILIWHIYIALKPFNVNMLSLSKTNIQRIKYIKYLSK